MVNSASKLCNFQRAKAHCTLTTKFLQIFLQNETITSYPLPFHLSTNFCTIYWKGA